MFQFDDCCNLAVRYEAQLGHKYRHNNIKINLQRYAAAALSPKPDLADAPDLSTYFCCFMVRLLVSQVSSEQKQKRDCFSKKILHLLSKLKNIKHYIRRIVHL